MPTVKVPLEDTPYKLSLADSIVAFCGMAFKPGNLRNDRICPVAHPLLSNVHAPTGISSTWGCTVLAAVAKGVPVLQLCVAKTYPTSASAPAG